VHGDDATGVLRPSGLAALARSHTDEYPLLPPLPGELEGGWAPPGGGPVQRAGRAARTQAGPILHAEWPAGVPCLGPYLSGHDRLAGRVETAPLVPSGSTRRRSGDGPV